LLDGENEGLFVVQGGIKKLDKDEYWNSFLTTNYSKYFEYHLIHYIYVVSKRSSIHNIGEQIKEMLLKR
jgi:hypothetical protein